MTNKNPFHWNETIQKLYGNENEEVEEITFNVGDVVRHKYTKVIKTISDFGTSGGNGGKVSIGCVNATKNEWELIERKSE